MDVNNMIITVSNRSVQMDEDDHEKFKVKGNFFNVTSHGYVRVLKYLGNNKYKQQYLHRLVMDAPKEMQVDHINGDKLDNRKENLRVCTNTENAKNRPAFSGKYKGVHFAKKQRKWVAQITVNRKIYNLGSHENAEHAALAYNEAAIKYHGEYAYLNTIN